MAINIIDFKIFRNFFILSPTKLELEVNKGRFRKFWTIDAEDYYGKDKGKVNYPPYWKNYF